MESFEHLRGSALILLTSRDPITGRAVHRPVRMSFDETGDGFFDAFGGGSLARRLDDCPDVRLARSDLRGRPGGSDQPGRVARDTEPGATLISGILAARRVRYRVSPTSEPTPW